MKKSLISLALAATAAFSATNAHAYVTYSGFDVNGSSYTALTETPNSTAAANSFLANLVGTGTETFETRMGSAPLVLDFGAAGTATLTGAGTVASNSPGSSNGAGRYSVPGGVQFWEASAGIGNDFQINFSQKVAAIGFYGIDIGDFNGTLSLQFRDNNDVVISTLNIPSAPTELADGSVLYFGAIAETDAELFSSVRFVSEAGGGDIFAFDSVTIGNKQQVQVPPQGEVPEPATFALLGLGMLGFGAARRKGAKRG